MEQPNLGKRISELRKAKGLTQEELAEQSKISVRTLQRIESGVVTPRAYTIRVIYAVLKKDSSFMSLHFEYLKDLFNLKKNTMKKVSILTVFALTLGFGLFALCPESKAQVDMKKYVEDNSRGIIWLRPKGLLGYGQYFRNDTLFLHAGKDLIKEFNGNVYLNDRFFDCAYEGDTVIFHKASFLKRAKLEFKHVEYKETRLPNGSVYIIPKYPPTQMQFEIHKTEDVNKFKLFINGVDKGDVLKNDTVILRPRGTLIIKRHE